MGRGGVFVLFVVLGLLFLMAALVVFWLWFCCILVGVGVVVVVGRLGLEHVVASLLEESVVVVCLFLFLVLVALARRLHGGAEGVDPSFDGFHLGIELGVQLLLQLLTGGAQLVGAIVEGFAACGINRMWLVRRYESSSSFR